MGFGMDLISTLVPAKRRRGLPFLGCGVFFKLFATAGVIVLTPLFCCPAWSYVGPGVGITMLGSFWVFVSFLGVLIAGMLIWPIRLFFGRRRTDKARKDSIAKPEDQ